MKAAQLEIGVRSQEAGGKSQKEAARRSVFTNIAILNDYTRYQEERGNADPEEEPP